MCPLQGPGRNGGREQALLLLAVLKLTRAALYQNATGHQDFTSVRTAEQHTQSPRTLAGTQCHTRAQKPRGRGPQTRACRRLSDRPHPTMHPLWAHGSHTSFHICFRGPSRLDSGSPPALLPWSPSRGGFGGSPRVLIGTSLSL